MDYDPYEHDDIPRRPDGRVKQVYESVELPNYVPSKRSHRHRRETYDPWYSSLESPNSTDWKRQDRYERFDRNATWALVTTYLELITGVIAYYWMYQTGRLESLGHVRFLAVAFGVFLFSDVAFILYFLIESVRTNWKFRCFVVIVWIAIPLMANLGMLLSLIR